MDKLGWLYKGLIREEIRINETPLVKLNAAREFEGNETESNIENEDAVQTDGRNSNILTIIPQLRLFLRNEINDTTILRKSYNSNDWL